METLGNVVSSMLTIRSIWMLSTGPLKSFKVYPVMWYWYVTEINRINIFSIYPCCDLALMLSTISNSEKRKYLISTLLSHYSYSFHIKLLSLRRDTTYCWTSFFDVFSHFYQYGLNTANANIMARQFLQVYYESHVIMYISFSPSIYIFILFWFNEILYFISIF